MSYHHNTYKNDDLTKKNFWPQRLFWPPPVCGCSHIRTSPNADVPIYGLLACGPIFYEIRTSKSPNTDFPKCGLPQMRTSPNTDLFDIRADVFFTSVRTYTRSVYGKTTSPHLVKRTCVFIVSENIVVKLKKKKSIHPLGVLVANLANVVTNMVRSVRYCPRSNPNPNHVSTRGELHLPWVLGSNCQHPDSNTWPEHRAKHH